jgi:hypothetical protein
MKFKVHNYKFDLDGATAHIQGPNQERCELLIKTFLEISQDNPAFKYMLLAYMQFPFDKPDPDMEKELAELLDIPHPDDTDVVFHSEPYTFQDKVDIDRDNRIEVWGDIAKNIKHTATLKQICLLLDLGVNPKELDNITKAEASKKIGSMLHGKKEE